MRQYQVKGPLCQGRRCDDEPSRAERALSDGRSERPGDNMRWTSPDGRVHKPAPSAQLTPPKYGLMIPSQSAPWRTYGRMMATVLPAFLLLYAALMLTIGVLEWNPSLIIGGGLFALPLVLFVLRLTRPSVIQVWNAVPDSNGSTLHNRPDSSSITTMNPTRMERHLLLDGTPLEFPSSWSPWALFLGCVFVSILLSLATTSTGMSDGAIVIFVLLAIPLWLLGFSIPVLAWWSVASRRLRLPIRRVQAEGWLVAGMISAFPAFLANSLLTPGMIPESWNSIQTDLALIAVGAPIIEETCKALVILLFIPTLRGPRSGFMVGFSVGLGFALIENVQYIAGSLFGGPASLAATTLIRGVGSIPAHALWTALVGSAIGGFVGSRALNMKLSLAIARTQIGVIDTVEKIGVDVYGDGLSVGFTESPVFLEAALSDGIWSVRDPKNLTGEPQAISDEPSAAPTSRPISLAFCLAVFGHALWNGLSVGSYAAAEEAGFSETASLLMTATVVLCMVISVILLTLRESRKHSPL